MVRKYLAEPTHSNDRFQGILNLNPLTWSLFMEWKRSGKTGFSNFINHLAERVTKLETRDLPTPYLNDVHQFLKKTIAEIEQLEKRDCTQTNRPKTIERFKKWRNPIGEKYDYAHKRIFVNIESIPLFFFQDYDTLKRGLTLYDSSSETKELVYLFIEELKKEGVLNNGQG